jgi:hypothetical protein
MSIFLKYTTLTALLFFTWSCSTPEEKKEKIVVPEKITYLFVTQPSCPSCDRLEETMELETVKKVLNKYFEVKKIYLGEKLPDGLMEPNGTPTVYFLGANNEVLVEPMVGEKKEEGLMAFLEDALLEFKNTYHVDLIAKETAKTNIHESNTSESNTSYAEAL